MTSISVVGEDELDELLPLTRAVSRSVTRSLVVGDLPFGSYQRSPEQAYDTAVRFMKEGGAHAVKLEGGREMAPQIELLSRGGVPVMAHIGFTPQSEHALGGYRVQGRGETAERLLDDARAVEVGQHVDGQRGREVRPVQEHGERGQHHKGAVAKSGTNDSVEHVRFSSVGCYGCNAAIFLSPGGAWDGSQGCSESSSATPGTRRERT